MVAVVPLPFALIVAVVGKTVLTIIVFFEVGIVVIFVVCVSFFVYTVPIIVGVVGAFVTGMPVSVLIVTVDVVFTIVVGVAVIFVCRCSLCAILRISFL